MVSKAFNRDLILSPIAAGLLAFTSACKQHFGLKYFNYADYFKILNFAINKSYRMLIICTRVVCSRQHMVDIIFSIYLAAKQLQGLDLI